MWSRSTAPYSLACEKILPRQDAYALYGMTLELLSEFYHFWYLGIFIVLLVTIPYFILQTLIFGYSKESPLLKSLAPLISRGVLILILWYFSWLANSESENVEDLVTGLSKITTENKSCVDDYTSAFSSKTLSKLKKAQGDVDSHSFWFNVLFMLCFAEIVGLTLHFIKERFSSSSE